MNKRIIFTGAQGTGKTTILNMFREHNYPVITEVVRNLVKTRGIKINEMGNDEGQQLIWEAYREALSVKKYVSDRGLTDVLAYSLVGSASTELCSIQCQDFEDWSEQYPDVVYIYFPIEFAVVDDGVRSMDEEYRHKVDQAIKEILDNAEIDYLEVHGTPEERFKQILDFVGPDLF